ncbi:MAG TPA: molecular chaperone DnaJ, partial [Proteobacteria bacterium]|nr:molecular chaperone DnaJ [Pseudomonadota bacterium]
HRIFARQGDDLLVRVPVSFAQAALGATIEVPTLDGTAKLTIPRGTRSGQTFRIKGKGIPRLNSLGRGDLIVQTEIEVPKKLTKEQAELLKRFDELEQKRSGKKSLIDRIKDLAKGS